MNIKKLLPIFLIAASSIFGSCGTSPGEQRSRDPADSGDKIENVDMNIGTSINMTTGQTGMTMGVGNGVAINPMNGQLSIGVGNNLYINPANGQVSMGF